MKTLLPTISFPNLSLIIPGRHKPRQRFQAGDYIQYECFGFNKTLIKGVKRYKFFGKVWLIRYRLDFANVKRCQMTLLLMQRKYNRQHGIVEGEEVRPKTNSTFCTEIEGDW